MTGKSLHTGRYRQTMRTDTTDYVGCFVLVNGQIERCAFDDGYVDCSSTGNPAAGNICFYLLDHVGSVRAVVGENNQLLQEQHYYPSGMIMPGIGSGHALQPVKFSGKELDRMHGLEWHDFGARPYDAALMQWPTPDPLRFETTHLSQYCFCAGNPIRFIDTDGEKPSVYEAALMAKIVYDKDLSNDKLPDDLKDSGWALSSFNTSITMNLTAWYENGLQSALFERTINGVTEYAYVFAGSNSVEDYLEDFAQFFGHAPQYDSAIQNAETLSKELRKSELTFVGHSLGGGEAAASSMSTGRNAITFNAAAVSPSTKRAHNLGNADNVINYRMGAPGTGRIRIGGCFVSNFQNNIGMSAAGKQVRIIASNHNPYTAHRISNFVNYFRNK